MNKPRRRARTLVERAKQILDFAQSPDGVALQKSPEAQELLALVHKEAEALARSPHERIVAVRRRQGAVSRRQTTTQALFTSCTEVRRRIKIRYRGPKHAELRKDFGEGMPASAAKPESVLRLAQQILKVAPTREAELKEVRVGQATIGRIASLCENLNSSNKDRVEWRGKEHRLTHDLAARVSALEDVLLRLAVLARSLGLLSE